MKLEYTKYGAINMLWSFIPIFPVWTIFPGIYAGKLIGDKINNCVLGYEITKWIFIGLSVITILFITLIIPKQLNKLAEKTRRSRYRLYNILLYTLINTSILIIIIGTRNCCEGDGQSVLAVIFSAPITSLTLPVIGLTIDLLNNK